MSGDIRKLRSDYLFPLANLCHISGPAVDDLTLNDFAIHVDSIDAYLRADAPT